MEGNGPLLCKVKVEGNLICCKDIHLWSPMIIHEDGSIYTRQELNSDVTEVLADFPALDDLRDSFSGHSLRAGLSTILAVLGFSENEIKSWGRWRSDAYLRLGIWRLKCQLAGLGLLF